MELSTNQLDMWRQAIEMELLSRTPDQIGYLERELLGGDVNTIFSMDEAHDLIEHSGQSALELMAAVGSRWCLYDPYWYVDGYGRYESLYSSHDAWSMIDIGTLVEWLADYPDDAYEWIGLDIEEVLNDPDGLADDRYTASKAGDDNE